MKDELLVAIELAVEKVIEAKSDVFADSLLAKLAESIPGQLDDAIIEKVKPQVKEELKKFLLGQAEKISDKV